MKRLILLLILIGEASAGVECRNPAIKHKFDVMNGFPHGRPGYIVDHICPLAQGGIDHPRNMQYQTIADSHAKDRWENTVMGKKLLCNAWNSTPSRRVFNCKDD